MNLAMPYTAYWRTPLTLVYRGLLFIGILWSYLVKSWKTGAMKKKHLNFSLNIIRQVKLYPWNLLIRSKHRHRLWKGWLPCVNWVLDYWIWAGMRKRSEEHTSELQSRE